MTLLVKSVWAFLCQRYGLWDREGPQEETSTEDKKKKKKAEEEMEDKTVEPDAAEPQTDVKTETQTEPEETQHAEITPEPEEPRKKGGLLRFRKKKSSEKGNVKEKKTLMPYKVALLFQ